MASCISKLIIMNYNIENWPFRWFGFWREYGIDYVNLPSINDFIDFDLNQKCDVIRMLLYLRNGRVLASTSMSSFPSPISGEFGRGAGSIRTDGKWLWFDPVCDLIENNGVVIPKMFYLDIIKNNFIIPEISDEDIDKLEWPQI